MKTPFDSSSPARIATRSRASGAAAMAPLGPGTNLRDGLNAEVQPETSVAVIRAATARAVA